MKLKRTTSYAILPLIVICVIALSIGFSFYIHVLHPLNSLNLPTSSIPTEYDTLSVALNDGQIFYKGTTVNIEELKTLIQHDIEDVEDNKSAIIAITAEKKTTINDIVSIMDMALELKIGAILTNQSSQ